MKDLFNNLHKRVWSNVIEVTDIGKYRIEDVRYIIALFILIIACPRNLWVGGLPEPLFNPPLLSLANLIDSFPSITTIKLLYVSFVTSVVLFGTNYRPQFFGILAFLTWVIILNFSFSFGSIGHSTVTMSTILCFALGAKIHSNEKKLIPIPPSTLLAIFISFGYLTAGIGKAVCWVDFNLNTGGFLDWHSSEFYVHGQTNFLLKYVPYFPRIVTEIMDYTAVVFELAPILIIFFGKKKHWQLWVISACIFHFLNLILLNISFTPMALIYLPFVIINNRSKESYLENTKRKRLLYFILTLIGITLLITLIGFNKRTIDFIRFYTKDAYNNYYLIDFFIWIYIIYFVARSVFRKPSDLK